MFLKDSNFTWLFLTTVSINLQVFLIIWTLEGTIVSLLAKNLTKIKQVLKRFLDIFIDNQKY